MGPPVSPSVRRPEELRRAGVGTGKRLGRGAATAARATRKEALAGRLRRTAADGGGSARQLRDADRRSGAIALLRLSDRVAFESKFACNRYYSQWRGGHVVSTEYTVHIHTYL